MLAKSFCQTNELCFLTERFLTKQQQQQQK